MPDTAAPEPTSKITLIAWIAVPLLLAVISIEVGSLALVSGRDTGIALPLVICGVLLIAAVARVLLRRK
jgi:hypothetical protein